MHAWVFYDSISFHIDSVESTCWGIKFRVSDVKLDTIRYFSPVTKRKIEIGNPVKVKWNWKDQDDAAQEMEKSYYTFSTDPPVDTTTYVATITNAYRNTQTDSFIIYNPLATKAKYVLHDDGETYFKLDTAKPSGGAPLRVKIANDSKNGKEYQWFFKAEFQNSETTDTLCPIPPDPTRYITTDLKDTVFSIFYFPGKYIIKLVSIAKTQCDPDTFSFTSSDASETFPYTLKINKPESPVALPLPNWFKPEQERFMFNVTPEGQSLVPAEEEKTINPHSAKWDINSMSMRSMNIKIFNRWGQIVYEYEGVLETNEGDKYWEGWDGKDGNRDCDAGIYYWYIIFHSIEGVDYHDYLQGNKSRKSSSTSGTGTGTGTSGTTPTTDQSKDPKNTQNILSGYVFLIR